MQSKDLWVLFKGMILRNKLPNNFNEARFLINLKITVENEQGGYTLVVFALELFSFRICIYDKKWNLI